MLSVIQENNSIYGDRKRRDQSVRNEMKEKNQNLEEGGCLYEKAKPFLLYNIIPLCKVVPSVLFRIFGWTIIFGYLSELFYGKAVFILGVIFLMVPSISYIIGTVKTFNLKLKWDESLLNSVVGMILPIYIDLHTPVSSFRIQYKNILGYDSFYM